MHVKGVLKVGPALSIVVALAAGVLTSSPSEPINSMPTPCSQHADSSDYYVDTPCDPVDTKSTAAESWPWLPLLLPFLVGLGILETALFHTAVYCIIGTIKNQPELWKRWRLTAAGALGLACMAQIALFAGLVAVAIRMRKMMRDGSFASATTFSAFDPKLDEYPLQPIIWATPVVIGCYWLLLNTLCKLEVKKKSKKEELEEKLVKDSMDILKLPITKM